LRGSQRLRSLPGRRWSAALALLLFFAWEPAFPAPAAAATTLEVDAGWGGSYHPGQQVPVRVTVIADRLLRGDLQVEVAGVTTTPTVERPVEVPGGSAEEHLFVLSSAAEQPGAEVRAVLRVDDEVVASGTSVLQPAGDAELVGLAPGALGGRPVPGTAPLAIDAGTATFSAIDTIVLETPGGLGSLDVLGVGVGELAGLGEVGLDAVLAWVSAGGHLLVDEAPGVDPPGLPELWRPGPDGRERAGLGEVVSVDGALADGRFAGLVEPTPAERSSAPQFGTGEPIDGALARDAGVRLPKLSWLVAFLAAYVVVAVPVTLTVLRRRGRGELGWVVLPLVALAFTGGGYLAGRDLRSGATASHATIVVSTGARAVATTSVGVVSDAGGTVATTFPTGWVPAASGTSWSGPRTPVAAVQTNDGIELRQRLRPGEFGIGSATGPVSLAGALEVSASSAGDGQLTGVIRSSLPFDLSEVAVFQGQSSVTVGSVPAGGEVTWALEPSAEADPFIAGAQAAWREASGFDRPPDPTSIVAFPLWERFNAETRAGYRSPGSVVVAGWTRDFTPPADPGARSLVGRTLVVSTAAVGTQGALVDVGVRTEMVRSPVDQDGTDDDPFVFKFTLPTGEPVDTASLVLRSTVTGTAIEVWRDDAWVPLVPAAADVPAGPNGQPFDHRLPADSSRQGVIWARASRSVDPYLVDAVDSVTLRRSP